MIDIQEFDFYYEIRFNGPRIVKIPKRTPPSFREDILDQAIKYHVNNLLHGTGLMIIYKDHYADLQKRIERQRETIAELESDLAALSRAVGEVFKDRNEI